MKIKISILLYVLLGVWTTEAQQKKWTLQECVEYALENNINRLEEDHKKAKEIEESLKSLYFVKKVEEVETNIIIFEINSNYSSEIFISKLQKKGVKLI